MISSNGGRAVNLIADAGRTLRLGDASTFTGPAVITGAGTVEAGTLANTGIASSLGAGIANASSILGGGTLSYTGADTSSNRNWSLSNGTLSNDGSGALNLSGTMAIGNTATLGGSFTGADNVFSGVISGTGNLRSGDDATWLLTGANTYTGRTIVDSGILRAGVADAFGASSGATVNGGVLDMNGFDYTFATLIGTGGTVDLGSATLTLEAAAGTSASYAGNITGTGGLTKLGASTQTLTGASTYTGDTTIGGGILNLSFSGAGDPTSDIIASASTLNMGGGTLNVIGAAGESNTQTFDGVFVTAGNNTIDASSGTGGSLTVNLGTITRSGGLMNFNLPTSGNITTTNTTLGGWATVNGTDYAKVVGGNITAFVDADYTDKDNAANWLDNEFITDVAGFFGTVNGTVQLGGLRYTVPVSTTVTVDPGQTLGVDGTIIVAPSVLNTDQVITGGMLTGTLGGGTLGFQQNSTGNFTIASQIVDNGGSIGFTKAGTGLVTLTNANNSYTGATQVVQGTLSVSDIGNGGVASGIGASSADASNLVLEGATLRYTGGTTTSDRGFTLGKSGAILGSGIEVTNAASNLTFGGLVTSADDANFTKSGAGTLTLSNDTNDLTGIVTVTGGLLSVDTLANGGVVSGIGAGGSASANLVLNGGGLQYTGATTATDRGMTLGTNDGTIDVTDGGTTLTVSGAVVGSGGTLTKNGAGMLVLSGTNTYNGGNTVNGGILRASSTQAFGGTGTMTLANTAGVGLELDNFDNTIGALVGGGANGGNVTLGSATLRINGGNGNYSGTISGTGGIWRTGGGTQTFNGCNHTYTGPTTLQGANISTDCLLDGGLASGIGASSADSTNLAFNGGSLLYSGGSVAIDRGFQLLGTGGINVINAGTTLEFEGTVIGGGTLIKRNAGTLVLSGTNTYTGNTQVEGGVLRAAVTNAFGPQGHMTLNNTAGVLLDLDGFDTAVTSLIGGGANGGNIDLGSATLTVNSIDNRIYAGAISGTGNLVKNGGTIQALSGCDSSYTGTTTINAGVLSVSCLEDGGVNSSIGASTSDPANLVLDGGTLRYAGAGGSTNRQFTLDTNGGTIDASGSGTIDFSYTGPVTLAGANGARTLTLTGPNTGTNIFAAQLDDNGTGATSLTKTSDGLWRLTSATSSYTGVTTISGGILEVDEFADGGMASSIGAATNDAANLVIGNGSTLRYTGVGDSSDRRFTLATGVAFIESSGTGALEFTNTGAVTLTGTDTARTMALGGTNTGDNTFGGAITDNGTGATTLAKNDSGTWVLTGNNTFTGNTVINDGNLVIGNGGTTGNAGFGNVIVDSPTSTLSLNRSDTFSFEGTLSGPGTLAQIGSGISVLTSADNAIGATVIENGTLQVDGGLQTPTLEMTGTSVLTVNGTVQAENAIQTLLTGDTGNQTLTINAGGLLLASGDLGAGNDTMNLTGTLDTGTGTLALGDGDDTLVLNDGAQILGSGVAAAGGGGTDTLVINTLLGFTLAGDDIDTFNILTKQNIGELTLTGAHDFNAGTNIEGGTLSANGTVLTPTLSMADDTTLNLDGSLEAGGGTATVITGSTGDNTVALGIGSNLIANGSLGAGNDVLDVAGTLNTDGGVFDLGDADDTLIVRDGSLLEGVVNGGTGSDSLIADITTSATLDGMAGFEELTKTNIGTLHIDGPAPSDFTTVNVLGGILDIGVNGNVSGVVDTTVASGTTLQVDGSYSGTAGNDSFVLAGTVSGSGTLNLGDGDDALTLNDGAILSNVISGGAGAGDTLLLNNALALTFDGGNTAGFEFLQKDNSGEATITGTQTFSGGTALNDGTLTLAGSFETPTVNLADDTVLNITGSVQNSGGTAAVITGSTGNNTVNVGTGGTLLASGDLGNGDNTVRIDGLLDTTGLDFVLGDGTDTLDVAGTLDVGGGTFFLGAGDDNFIVHDGTVVIGTVEGGDGFDTRTYVINTTADLGALVNFEGVTKTGIGTLNVTGPGTTDLQEVQVLEGTLNVQAGASMIATPGESLDSLVASGATLNVDGAFGCGDEADTLTVSGTLTGSGSVDLCAGDDTLTLNDGASIAGLANPLTGGDGDDRVVLNNAGDFTLDGGQLSGFELLQKDNIGEAILIGQHTYSSGTNLNEGTLTINGELLTTIATLSNDTVLNVNSAMEATDLLGSAGNNTVNVGTGGTLVASGDLGEGNDLLVLAGTLDTDGGVFALGGGDDTFTLTDGGEMVGLVDGGTGTNTFNTDINTVADLGAVQNFQVLDKTGVGVLNVNGPASSDFATVNVNEGTLNIGPAGEINGVQNATVASGAILHLDGNLLFTAGDDNLTVAGTVTGNGPITLGDGNDTFTLQDGADLSGLAIPADGGVGSNTLITDIATSATLGGTTNFQTLDKTNVGTLIVAGPAASDFTTVNVLGGTLEVGPAGDISGVVTTTVASDATLQVDGSYSGSAGNDSMTVSGTVSGSGTLNLGDGDDALTLNDGAILSNVISGGAGAGDTLLLNNALALTFDGGNTAGFEFLQKDNSGEATITGTQTFSGGTALNDGTLTLAGSFETPTVNLADDTVLNITGSVQNSGGTAAVITGSTGNNTVNVGTGGTLLASGDLGNGDNTVRIDGLLDTTGLDFVLGDGTDTLDVAGTLDVGGGTFFLGAGDDNFIVHDGTVVIGTVEGGDGFDTRTYVINTTADLGALVNFEGVTKTGIGTLNVTGPGTTDLQEVQVLEGTLNVQAGASMIATPGESLDSLVASGATLNVDGAFGCGDEADTLTVSGTLTGSGSVDLCAGDDTLTLNDGASIAGLANPLTGGDGDDRVVLNNAGDFTLDGGQLSGFELLQKDNIGEAILADIHAFSGGTTLNDGTLTVAGQLLTPTVAMADDTVLQVDGMLEAGGGTATVFSGSVGTNTVRVASGAALIASGDLGDGADVLDVAGTLNTGGGVLSLGDGNDTFTIHDGTVVIGSVDGGAGLDIFNPDINTSADLGALTSFEVLTKTGTGMLNVTGPAASNFDEVNVLEGTLNIGLAGEINSVQRATVANGATLNLDGNFLFTPGDDVFTVAGTVTGLSGIDMLDGDDTLIIQDGANLAELATPIDGGSGDNTLVTDIATSATLGGVTHFQTLDKTNVGTLIVAGPAVSDFTAVNVLGGTLHIGPEGSVIAPASGILNTFIASGAVLNVDGAYGCGDGENILEVSGTLTGSGTVDLCAGSDTLILNDGALLAMVVDGNVPTEGSDIVIINNEATSEYDLDMIVNFEHLEKNGGGEALLTGSGVISGDTTINAGVLTVVGQLDTPLLSMADNTMLNVDGILQAPGDSFTTLTGSDGTNTVTVAGTGTLFTQADFGGGNDVLTTRGTVIGTLAFGDGDDTASFIGSDISGLTAIDGGVGGSDVINFHNMQVNGDTLPISNWERLNLIDNTHMNLSSLLELNGGVMSIDTSSALFASDGASISASMFNAGLINTGTSRLTISGNYTGDAGLLQVDVSPANGTSGGLDITGNIGGTTGVVFASDGTDVTETTAIQVITSPNAAPDAFRAADSDDGRIVRLAGSILPWTFAQDETDNNWYLSTEADHVLPELPAYASLQSLSIVTIRQTDNLVHQRLAGARGAGRPECDLSPEERVEQTNTRFLDDCNGFWTAITRDQLELGGNPGFDVSGDDIGLYVGADGAVDRPGRTLRGGAYLGFIQGDYRTTGNGSAEIPAISSASIDLETLTGGFYTSTTWNDGTYFNAILNGHRPRATVETTDGFKEELTGNSLTLNLRMGRHYRLAHDWGIEPQLQVSASMVNWSDVIDPAGKQLAFNNEVVSTVRAGVRVSKEITRANGAVIRPWVTLAALKTLGQSDDQLSVQSSPTATAQTFPNHDLGTSATLDLGLEATLSDRISVFGVVSTGKEIEGTEFTQQSGYLGLRIRW